MPRASTRALMSPKISGDISGLRLAKGYACYLLSSASPTMATLAKRIIGREPKLHITAEHVEILDRPDILLEQLHQLGAFDSEGGNAQNTEAVRSALIQIQQKGSLELFDQICIHEI